MLNMLVAGEMQLVKVEGIPNVEAGFRVKREDFEEIEKRLGSTPGIMEKSLKQLKEMAKQKETEKHET